MCDCFCNCDDDERYVPETMPDLQRFSEILLLSENFSFFATVLGNDADAEMEAVRARDCHRDVLDAMGIGA